MLVRADPKTTEPSQPIAVPARPERYALCLRVAANLMRAAELSIEHAAHHLERGDRDAAATELERARQARSAAERARQFALTMRLSSSEAAAREPREG